MIIFANNQFIICDIKCQKTVKSNSHWDFLKPNWHINCSNNSLKSKSKITIDQSTFSTINQLIVSALKNRKNFLCRKFNTAQNHGVLQNIGQSKIFYRSKKHWLITFFTWLFRQIFPTTKSLLWYEEDSAINVLFKARERLSHGLNAETDNYDEIGREPRTIVLKARFPIVTLSHYCMYWSRVFPFS